MKSYGSCLLAFALNRRCISLGPLAFGESSVSKRVKNILRFKKPRLWVSIAGTIIVVIIGIMCLTNGSGIGESQTFQELNNSIFSETPIPDDRTNFMIVGIDDEALFADTIIVGSYVNSKNELNLISIPRYTCISFTDEQKEIIKGMGKNIPKLIKINAINAYGESKYGIKFLKEQIEVLFGVDINYYFKINMKGFKNIVNSIGGIYFEVPKQGMYYSDPIQNLYININGGYQLLDGSKAEGLIRFRKDYPNQDLQRTEVSREFIKEFINQLLQKDSVKNNLNDFIVNCIKYIETDFTVSDVTKYISQIDDFGIKNFNSEILPGNYKVIDERLYYIYDISETKKITDKFFH